MLYDCILSNWLDLERVLFSNHMVCQCSAIYLLLCQDTGVKTWNCDIMLLSKLLRKANIDLWITIRFLGQKNPSDLSQESSPAKTTPFQAQPVT
jgi:hypothetical protein